MSRPSVPPRRRRRRAAGVIRDAHGNRISTEALGASPAQAARSAPKREAASAPSRARVRPARREPESTSGLRPAFGLAAALVILIGGAYLLLPAPPVAAAAPRDEAATRKALYLGVLKVEAYRKLNGMVPFEIEVANIRRKDGYAYERVDDRHYVLTFREPDGRALSFDSHTPIEKYFGPPEAILGDGEGS